ncbi:MAG TPA: hypothetical protein VIL84_11190 [Devosiaceae bacterium]
MHQGEPRDEYLDASNNARHFQTIRFAQPTVLISLFVALVTILHVSKIELGSLTRTLIELFGLVATLSFWVLQERTMLFWNHFVQRAGELEEQLGFRQYSTRPRPALGLLSSTNAMRGIFIVLAAFWIVSLIWIP